MLAYFAAMLGGMKEEVLAPVVGVYGGDGFYLAVREDGTTTPYGLEYTTSRMPDADIYPPPECVGTVVKSSTLGYATILVNDQGEVFKYGYDSYGALVPDTAVDSAIAAADMFDLQSRHIITVKNGAATVHKFGESSVSQSDLDDLPSISKMATLSSKGLVISDDGELDYYGDLYSLTHDWANKPIEYPGDLVAVSLSHWTSYTSFAARQGGEIVRVGSATDDQDLNQPESVPGAVELVSSSNTTMALTNAGTLVVWGQDSNEVTIPAPLTDGTDKVVSMDYIGGKFQAFTESGKMYHWSKGEPVVIPDGMPDEINPYFEES